MQTGDEYFDSKEFRDILISYEKSAESGQPIFMDVDDLADIADYYSYIGKLEQARAVIDFALEMNPGATAPLVFKAREALSKEDIPLAEAFAEKIIDKEDPEYKYLITELLVAQKKTDEAESYLKEYFATVPPDEHEDFVLDAANIYADYGMNDKAYEWIMRTNSCKRAEYKELMTRILYGLGQYDKSAQLCEELIDRNPFAKRYWNALASAQFMQEDFNKAVNSIEYAIAIDPEDPDGLLIKANCLHRLNDYEGALEYYKRYNAQVPDDEFGLLNQGTCLVNMSRFDESIKLLEAIISKKNENSPFKVQILQEMAFAYSAMKMPEKAISCIDATDSLDCDHLDMEVLRGHILLENGCYDEAEKRFQRAINESDNAPSILLRIMVSLYDNKYVETSYNMFKKFFDMMDDEFDEGYAYMALCCWDMNRPDEFMHYLKIALERNPQEAKNVLSHLYPKGTDVKDYYKYMYNKLNNKDNNGNTVQPAGQS